MVYRRVVSLECAAVVYRNGISFICAIVTRHHIDAHRYEFNIEEPILKMSQIQ